MEAPPTIPVKAPRKSTRKPRATGYGKGSVHLHKATGHWMAQCSIPDEMVKKVRKTFTGKTEREARDKMERAQAAAKLNVLTVTDGRAVTMGHAAQAWLDGKSDILPTSRRRYQVSVDQIVADLGHLPMPKVTIPVIRRWFVRLEQAGSKSRTALKSVLAQILGSAVEAGWIAQNPAREIRVKGTKRQYVVLEPEQRPVFEAAAAGHAEGNLWMTMILTGVRLGEAQALTWGDVDFEKRELRVRRSLARHKDGWRVHEPKTERGRRTVPLPAKAVLALQRQRQQQREARLAAGPSWTDDPRWRDLVFSGPHGEPAAPRTLLRHFDLEMKAAGLEKARLHDLRHSCATTMLDRGVPLQTVSAILGHADSAVTARVYSHFIKASLRSGADALDAAFA